MAHSARMDTRIAKRLLQKKKKLDEYRPLPAFTVQRLHKDLRVMLTYNSNAIEGNTLTLAETQMVLEYGVTVNGHRLPWATCPKRKDRGYQARPILVYHEGGCTALPC